MRLAFQLVEQRLRFFQTGGLKALGEPAVDFSEHRAYFAVLTLFWQATERDLSSRTAPTISPTVPVRSRWACERSPLLQLRRRVAPENRLALDAIELRRRWTRSRPFN